MFQRLNTSRLREAARTQLLALFSQHAEWYCTADQKRTMLLRRHEIDLSFSQDRLVLSCWTERGIKSWRVLGWHWNGQRLLLQASRRMGAERPAIELIPRAAAKAVAATIRAARQFRCEKLAQLCCLSQPENKIERMALSPGIRRGQPGIYARIVLRRKRERIAVTGPVTSSGAGSINAVLSSSLLWFKRTAERIRQPYVEQLWIVVPEGMEQNALSRIALLRQSLKDIIKLFVVDEALSSLRPVPTIERADLWKRKLARFPPVAPSSLTEQALSIIDIAPEAIDVVHNRYGQTLRYFGLPFARVRSLLGEERVWFGLSTSYRRILDHQSLPEWSNLLHDLKSYRSANAADYRHMLYLAAAESWLESLLRRDITKLDPGLIIAPVHAQFRTARATKIGTRPIDILALRQDGRLVVIELKVSEDREHVLQGADYWRRVEAHRRRGHIKSAKLFGERKILDLAPLVYLVAPTLRVHPSFTTLARCIATDIEIYRFDINEDWRAGVRVMRRLRAN